jgi:hypothetical protein
VAFIQLGPADVWTLDSERGGLVDAVRQRLQEALHDGRGSVEVPILHNGEPALLLANLSRVDFVIVGEAAGAPSGAPSSASSSLASRMAGAVGHALGGVSPSRPRRGVSPSRPTSAGVSPSRPPSGDGVSPS